MIHIDTETALLHALVVGDSYGLELIERVGRMTFGKVKLSQGSVYPALRSLEDAGLLSAYESEPMPERGGRARVYYKVTRAGHKVAHEDRVTIFALFGAVK